MAYLERFEPPELPAGASTLRRQLELGMVLHGRQVPPSPSTARLLTTYVITTDKAAREYTAGCRRIEDHMAAGGGIQAFVEGVGHFETCINSAKRALRALGRIGTQPDGPAIDRTIRRLAQTQAKAITDLRDAIEHMDADIVTGAGIPEGDPHLLTIDKQGDHLEIGLHRIPIIGLQSVVKALHAAGLAIIQALPTPDPSADA
jgi:hypothetical protein